MPRLLLIAYGCPPRVDAGSLRPTGLMKYLPRFGWEVIVLTAQLPAGPPAPVPVIEASYRDVLAEWKARLGMDPERGVHQQLRLPESTSPTSSPFHSTVLAAARFLIAYPDEWKGWIAGAKQTLDELKDKLAIDAIVSTSPPTSANLIGAHARRVFNRPWVADFRDLWAEQNYRGVQRMMQPFYRRLERKTLEFADALVTVSQPWAQRLQESYPTKPVYRVTNGFDPDDFCSERPPMTKRLSITHAGYLYEGMRDPRLLFEVLRDLIAQGLVDRSDFQIRFYGPAEPWLSRLVEDYGLQGIVNLGGVITRAEALQREAESQILLLLGWSDPREKGQHTGKLFEYFGSARPILAVGGARGVLTQTLEETKAGVHVQSATELRQYLLNAYQEFKSTGSVSYHPDRRAISRYTHAEMARKYSDILNEIIRGKNNSKQLSMATRGDSVGSAFSDPARGLDYRPDESLDLTEHGQSPR